MKYEYVMSACGFTKMFLYDPASEIESESIQLTAKMMAAMQGRNHHNLSLLCNAYTEQSYFPIVRTNLEHATHRVYGDSGGLQVVSRGSKITPELKDQVYKTQAQFCDVAMCFDEIPVKVLYSVSNPNFIGNRVYDAESLVRCATATAQNIKRQVDLFDSLASKAKPNVIMQGNSPESFQQWADTIAKVLGDDYLEKCSGLSLADTSDGIGLLDDIDRMFAASSLQVPESLSKHIHLLGIGRPRRLLPIIFFAEAGLFPHTQCISYDSSTHTRQLTIGYHFLNGKMTNFGNKHSHKYSAVAENIIKQSKMLFDYDIQEDVLYEVLVKGFRLTDDGKKRKPERVVSESIKTAVASVLVSIDNFCNTVYDATKDDIVLTRAVLDSKQEFLTLKQVKNAQDYKIWRKHCTNRLKSIKVKAVENNVLDLF